jgi:hypothetical protein
MMTVRQIERLWTAKSYDRLMSELLCNRTEAGIQKWLTCGSAMAAAAVAMIRLDELNQTDAPVFGQLLGVILATQEGDGGWGDMAVTAWCLRALSIDRGRGAAMERGMAYFATLQQAEGIWPGIPIRRMPADPFVSAFILFQLGSLPDFQRRIRFMDALDWFESQSARLDDECRAMWQRIRLRCRALAISH